MINEIDRARHALNFLDADCPREEWVRAGMAAKSCGLVFNDFHNWSASAGNYSNEKECREVWKSFSESGGITSATLYRMAHEQGWVDPVRRTNSPRPDTAKTKPQKLLNASLVQEGNANAMQVWENCIPATLSEGYIYIKQGNPDGLRVYPASCPPLVIRGQNIAGYLVVPCWSGDKLQTLQFVPQGKGDKLNLPNASFNNGFFTVGKVTDRVYVCEGIGQAWAVNKATGAAAVVCFGAGRMSRVTEVIRQKMPHTELVVVPDAGKEMQASEIAKNFSCGYVSLPENSPKNYDVNDYLMQHGTDALAELLEHCKTPTMHYKMLSAKTLSSVPPMVWLVRGVLPANGLSALYGASGSGKSFLALDMGCAIAGGDSEWFGRKVTKAPVTYVCLEGEAGLGKRIKAWNLHHNKPTPDTLRFITQPFNLLSDDVLELSKAIIAGGGANGLVMIDTLNRASAGADENSSADMGNIISASKLLQRQTGGMVLLVHHTGKDVAKGLRGHSSLYAALDGAIEVMKAGGRREWNVAKSKDDLTGEAHPFNLDVVCVDIDEEGDEITSCVAMPDKFIDKGFRKVLPPKSGHQKVIWEALQDVFKFSTKFGMEGAPEGRPCVTLDDAISKTKNRLVCELKRQRERTESAITGLVKRGLLVHKEGWLWIV
ncbi:MAG TPA: AAA family ATPase [Methylotenera sp.]